MLEDDRWEEWEWSLLLTITINHVWMTRACPMLIKSNPKIRGNDILYLQYKTKCGQSSNRKQKWYIGRTYVLQGKELKQQQMRAGPNCGGPAVKRGGLGTIMCCGRTAGLGCRKAWNSNVEGWSGREDHQNVRLTGVWRFWVEVEHTRRLLRQGAMMSLNAQSRINQCLRDWLSRYKCIINDSVGPTHGCPMQLLEIRDESGVRIICEGRDKAGCLRLPSIIGYVRLTYEVVWGCQRRWRKLNN